VLTSSNKTSNNSSLKSSRVSQRVDLIFYSLTDYGTEKCLIRIISVHLLNTVFVYTVQVTLVLHGGCVPANRRVYRKRLKKETYNNRHFDIKATPEFFDAKSIICITFPDKLREGSTQVIGFKIWPRIGY
jgi:hypothetical protein